MEILIVLIVALITFPLWFGPVLVICLLVVPILTVCALVAAPFVLLLAGFMHLLS